MTLECTSVFVLKDSLAFIVTLRLMSALQTLVNIMVHALILSTDFDVSANQVTLEWTVLFMLTAAHQIHVCIEGLAEKLKESGLCVNVLMDMLVEFVKQKSRDV